MSKHPKRFHQQTEELHNRFAKPLASTLTLSNVNKASFTSSCKPTRWHFLPEFFTNDRISDLIIMHHILSYA